MGVELKLVYGLVYIMEVLGGHRKEGVWGVSMKIQVKVSSPP
jgi:hypothetical protein